MNTHVAGAAGAMFLVGTLAAVSGVIADYPVHGGQALRYALAAVILLAVARTRGLGWVRLRARQWALLAALSLTGLVLFNVCVVEATRAAGPALPGIVLGTVPLALALVGPIFTGARPSPRVVAAGLVVVAGASLATGAGSGNVTGLLWSLGALVCELCFSLLALPLLPLIGPLRLSAWTSALAVPFLLVVGVTLDGRHVLRVPTGAEAAGLAYLALVVTTVAFFLWYRSLPHLGADRAGLFAGMIPVGALATAAFLGIAVPSAADLAGAALVISGIALGLRSPSPRRPVRSFAARRAAPLAPREGTTS
ncbi:DMT family transporter [Microbispora sp. NEAU-D428]|uniref:DMT family transporter n=1 Tax=Microbispora sitophila TaxID=2771537 RepID=UPI001868EF8C|nr:DMT family transporter [Microbispora sitophila]MBE3011495.1 DMT family transporter [Microbispora sitophila]